MSEIPGQDPKSGERFKVAAQLVGLAAGIAALMIAITSLLAFLAADCGDGGAHVPAIFFCAH